MSDYVREEALLAEHGRQIAEHEKQLAEHERRLSVTERSLQDMAPKIEMAEVERRMERKLEALERTILLSGQETQTRIQSLSDTVERHVDENAKTSKRLADLNEEMMREAAKEKAEKHQAELALKQAEIDRMAAAAKEREENAWHKRMAYWASWFAGILAALGVLWSIFSHAVQQVAK